MGKAVDRLVAATWVKRKVEEACKKVEADASDELAEFTANSSTGIASTYMDENGEPVLLAEYKYSQTKAKKVVEYGISGSGGLPEWIASNAEYIADWLATPEKKGGEAYAKKFAKWYFDMTGEVPEGMSRTEHEEPARRGAPKLYKFDADAVGSYLESHGGWLEGANRLLLGDGE